MAYPQTPQRSVPVRPGQYRLTIELIPESAWRKNLRAMMSQTQWDKIKDDVAEAAGHRCEICGGRGGRHPVECHERWSYDEKSWVQKLVGLLALCPSCHRAKHLGVSMRIGTIERDIGHLAKVNGIGRAEAEAYVQWAFDRQRSRMRLGWTQDVEWLRERYPESLREDRKAK